jgi:hypothetical protein
MTPTSGWVVDRAASTRQSARPERAAGAVPLHGDGVAADALATLGHELRTPLATLRVTLEVLAGLPAVGAEAERRALLPHLERSLGWLERLAENLTTAALAQSGRLALRRAPLALDGCLQGAVALLQPLLERRGQRVRVRCPAPAPRVAADPVGLGQVLVNLLSNASAYSPPGAEITVAVAAAAGAVEVRVHDRGPGVPRCEQGRIFRPYVRGRAGRGTGAGGVGLGLHIVRTLVELHGGTVGVHSPPGQGAAFWFRLPDAPLPADPGPEGPTAPAN